MVESRELTSVTPLAILVTTETNSKDKVAIITAVLEVFDLAQLSRILHKISRLPNIVEAYRPQPRVGSGG